MRERALIAEDNDDMRDLLQEVMEDAGYETLVAANGRQALTHIEKENEVIDLVITDVRMPEMTGRGLLAKARELRSEAPVIVITYGGLQMRVRDGCGTVQGAVATWRLRSGRSLRRQVATAPCTVPEIAPLSRKRNRKLI